MIEHGETDVETGQIVLYVIAGVMLLFWIRRRLLMASIPKVSLEEAEELFRSGKAVLVDVRSATERSRKSLKGSLHLPMSDVTNMRSRLEHHKDKQVIFYCASGSRSVWAASKAKKLGFSVSNLEGGIGW